MQEVEGRTTGYLQGDHQTHDPLQRSEAWNLGYVESIAVLSMYLSSLQDFVRRLVTSCRRIILPTSYRYAYCQISTTFQWHDFALARVSSILSLTRRFLSRCDHILSAKKAFLQRKMPYQSPQQKGTLVISGDGRYFNKEAIQIIAKIAVAAGVERLVETFVPYDSLKRALSDCGSDRMASFLPQRSLEHSLVGSSDGVLRPRQSCATVKADSRQVPPRHLATP